MGETTIEFNHFSFEIVKLYADYIHQKNLELGLNDKLQLLELAAWLKQKQLTKQLLEEIEDEEWCLDNEDRVEIAIAFMNVRYYLVQSIGTRLEFLRQKPIQDFVADITSEIALTEIDRHVNKMKKNIKKINIEDNVYYEDGEPLRMVLYTI